MKNRFGQTMKNTVKMNFGILMGLVILCLGLTVLTDKFATVTNFFNVVRQITINLYPVSYTHLDVYKRQVSRWVNNSEYSRDSR